MLDNACYAEGRLGNDVTTRFLDSGLTIVEGSIACYAGKDKNGDELPPNWVNFKWYVKPSNMFYGGIEAMKKGAYLDIKGEIATDSWDDRETGAKRYKTYIKASKVIVANLGSKPLATASVSGSYSVDPDDIPF